ncbi:odorant receptor 43a isoform X1 [Solenopsis invicta]|uniref:odorant receptor 43a isoform X1 n=2 Tax=Solenopsis invicta TaxID=13686 RepID=UPI00193DF12F|nr:odorant receptor 43a isoform X1 [Solenopsis invicta]
MYTTEIMKYADFEWATKLNRFTLNVAGLWPNIHENASNRFLSNLRAMFLLFLLVFVGIIPGLHSLVRTWGDMMATIDNLQFTLPLLTTIIKLVVIWWKKPDLVLVLNTIANDWSNVKTDKELHVMTKRAQSARVVTIFGYILMVVAMFLLICLPFFGTSLRYRTNITDPDKVLPLQTHYFYDKDQSPYYELTYVAQALLLLMSSASYTGVDNLLGLLIFHLCGQMENLKERIINTKQFNNFNGDLAVIVNEHIRLIKFFDIVESTFTVLLLGLLLYFGTLFCLYGFLIIAVLTEGREMSMIRLIYLISGALNVCGHMCLYCVVGEILVAQCEGIYRAAYNYEWYKLNPEEARSLIIIMIRANKTLHITAGKMFPMTLSMFCNLIKTSAGYVSILLAKQG